VFAIVHKSTCRLNDSPAITMTYRWHDINIQWTFSHLVDYFAQISQVLWHVLWWSHDHYTSYNRFTNVWWFLFHPCYMCHHCFHLCHCLLIVIALSCCVLSPKYRYLRWQVSTKMYQSCLCLHDFTMLKWERWVWIKTLSTDWNIKQRIKDGRMCYGHPFLLHISILDDYIL